MIRSICVTIWPIKIVLCTATYLILAPPPSRSIGPNGPIEIHEPILIIIQSFKKKKNKKMEKRENEEPLKIFEKIEFLERKISDLENYNSSLTDCLRDSYKFSTKLTMMTHQMDQLLTQRNVELAESRAEIIRLETELAESLNRNNSKGWFKSLFRKIKKSNFANMSHTNNESFE